MIPEIQKLVDSAIQQAEAKENQFKEPYGSEAEKIVALKQLESARQLRLWAVYAEQLK